MDNLIFRDTLLYVAVALIGYGAAILQTDFSKGLIALLVGAGIFVVRVVLKKKFYAKK